MVEAWTDKEANKLQHKIRALAAQVKDELGATGVALVVYWHSEEDGGGTHIIDGGIGPVPLAAVFRRMAINYDLLDATGLRMQ